MPLRSTRRVTRRQPCPICTKPDWCRVAQDGRYAICNRVTSSRPAKDAGGGWIHRLVEGSSDHKSFVPRPVALEKQSNIAGICRRDQAYRRLQSALVLQGNDRTALLHRGMTAREIIARRYRTLPLQGRAALARHAQEGTGGLQGVPGFWIATGPCGHYWSLAGSPGMAIPCRSPRGEIRAYRLRPHEQGAGGKYRWLSSGHKPGGTSSGVHCHVARSVSGKAAEDVVFVVEGELKADIAAERLSATALSIPGVGCWSLAITDLAELLPQGGRVVVALDADWRQNVQVHTALWDLAQACTVLGYQVEVALWNETWKGLDDLLVAGKTPTIVRLKEIPPPEWTMKVSSRVLAAAPPRCVLATQPLSLPDLRDHMAATVLSGAFLCPCA